MQRRISSIFTAALLAAASFATACDRSAAPTGLKRAGPQFTIAPSTDRITGGGELGDGHDFATFGFNAEPGQGELQWVQHCLDGVDPNSSSRVYGRFSFHASSVASYDSTQSDPQHCRTWTGSGDLKLNDPILAAQYDGTYQFRVDKGCDYGEPGAGTDCPSFTLSSYHDEGHLTGGNLQLHRAQ